jgi:hypothetical protein
MIRPITVICWILALSAGLYLYRAKHEVELMDKHIEQIAKQTADLRVESRQLLDDWIRLGEPEQLHKYSDEYLGLKAIAPTQFARLSDLAARLPAPQPDPPDAQPDVVAQSSGGASADASSSGAEAAGAQSASAEPAVTDADGVTEAGADDLPVPPIPPATPPVASVTLQAVTALPLQARPVTPRLAAGQPDPDAQRPRTAAPAGVADEPRAAAPTHVADEPRATAPARVADEPRAAAPTRVADEPRPTATRTTPVTLAEPRLGAPGQANAPGPGAPVPGPAARQARGLPPLQAQGPGNVQGLPPLQAQGPVQRLAQGTGQGPANGQAPGQAAFRPVEPRIADSRADDPRREVRPMQPPPAQTLDQRGPVTQVAGQAPPQMPPPGPSRNGSLLGMPRGPVPLPLPAPTPVSATWSGPVGSGPIGPGR